MATRLYFSLAQTPPVSPPFSLSYDYTVGAVRRSLLKAKSSSESLAAGTVIGPWQDTANFLALDRQYVSPPMSGGQTIEGSVAGQLMTREINADDDVTVVYLLISTARPDGSIRNVLTGGYYGSSLEFTTASTHENRTFRPYTDILPPVAIYEGDRLVVEIGYSATAGGNGPQAVAKWGAPSSMSDLPVNNTQTSDGVPWIEFADNISWLTHTGTVAGAMGDFISAASVTVIRVVGSVAGVMGDFISSAAGECFTSVSASVEATMGDFIGSASGVETIVGTPEGVIGDFIGEAAGVLTITGAVAGVMGDFISNTESSAYYGSVAATMDPFVSAAEAAVSPMASVAATMEPFLGAATGTLTIPGTVAHTMDNFVGSAVLYTWVSPPDAFAAIAQVMPPFISSCAALVSVIVGAGAGVMGDFVSSCSARVIVAGSVAQTLDNFVSNARGSVTGVTISGAGAGVIGDFISSASGREEIAGAVASSMGEFVGAAAGLVNEGDILRYQVSVQIERRIADVPPEDRFVTILPEIRTVVVPKEDRFPVVT